MFTKHFAKIAGITLLLSVATAYGHGQVTASAATAHAGRIAHNPAAAPGPQPNASNMWVTGPTSIAAGQDSAWTYNWSGGGFSGETFHTHFYNTGNHVDYDYYTYSCSQFCSSGQYNYDHTFATCGVTWQTYMIDQNQNKGQSLQFNVHC